MNKTFWSKLNKNDKQKLICVYLVIPLLKMAYLSSNFTSHMYSKTRELVTPPCGAIFGLVIFEYLPTILPPIAIRFGYFKRALNYGLELFVSMWVSIIISMLLVLFVTGVSIGTQGFLATLSVYCVLSYGATGYNDIPKFKRYVLTLLTIAAPFIHASPTVPSLFFFYEAPFIAIMVNCHLPKKSEVSYSSSGYTTEPPKSSPPPPHEEPPHSEPHEAPNPHQQHAIRLLSLGLAAIGRRTAQPNPYLTPEREAQRHNAERPFLLKLAPKYKDASARKVIAKHFMLYKEACLYIVFASLLKDNPELHSIVKQELTKQLSEGLSAQAKIRRKEYMFAFSRAFYDEYQRTRSVERVLSFMFWSVLQDKHSELGSEDMDGLAALYNYIYRAIKTQ